MYKQFVAQGRFASCLMTSGACRCGKGWTQGTGAWNIKMAHGGLAIRQRALIKRHKAAAVSSGHASDEEIMRSWLGKAASHRLHPIFVGSGTDAAKNHASLRLAHPRTNAMKAVAIVSGWISRTDETGERRAIPEGTRIRIESRANGYRVSL